MCSLWSWLDRWGEWFMQIAEFEVLLPLIGGLFIGLSALALLWFNGRVAGICGIAYGVMSRVTDGRFESAELSWRIIFLFGLVLGAGAFHRVSGAPIPVPEIDLFALIIGGLLVGLGTKIGSGCTSGHGVVGIGRLSVRSIVATATFMLFGVISVFVFRHLLGVI